jgi:hypothetical protein
MISEWLVEVDIKVCLDDVNPLGFVPDHSMRGVGDNSIEGDDVHGPTTTFPRMRLSNRYTTSYGCHDLVERVNRH